jgi:prepilin-type N-terminal cleavage/methylation domain-containing protein
MLFWTGMNWINKLIQDEEGYTLIESLIAIAILLAVLVPSTVFLAYVGNNVIAKDKITAFNHARNTMEYVLATENDSTITKQIESNWWVKRVIVQDGNLREIRIEVFKRDTLTEPLITLETARLWYSKN